MNSPATATAAAAAPVIAIGSRLMVTKTVGDKDIQVKGELLAMRTVGDNKTQFYIHYCDYNKRLDEWVPLERLHLDTLEAPAPKKLPTEGSGGANSKINSKSDSKHSGSNSKGAGSNNKGSGSSSSTNNSSSSRKRPNSKKKGHQRTSSFSAASEKATTAASGKENDASGIAADDTPAATPAASAGGAGDGIGEDDDNQDDNNNSMSIDKDDAINGSQQNQLQSSMDEDKNNGNSSGSKSIDPTTGEIISKEQEIANLRLGGSMTSRLEEVARVKNINRIEIGKYIVDTWYFSPYPEELAAQDTIYICEFCLGYHKSRKTLARHRTKCTLRHPPGNEIYRCGSISFFELDGHKQKLYCRNLCLISKLFLDHKTLYYDVDPFLFYIMTENDATGCHILGYFSKEKKSAMDYNVACILTLPQHQRKGYGKLLISFSYELSKREKKKGSPEKPLSDLGYLSYQSFWAEELIRLLLEMRDVSIDDLANITSFTQEDIISTLTTLEVLVYYKGKHIFKLSEKVIQDYQKSIKKQTIRIDPSCIRWEPPVFSAAQLKFV